jgi:hypothetical protein
MGGFPPTPEQAAIIDAAKNRQDLVVSACAGTGKTATLEMIAKDVAPRRGTYVAFGRDIAAEARSRFPANIVCKTAHAFALANTPPELKERFSAGRGARNGGDVAEALGITVGYRSENMELTISQMGMLAREMKANFCKSAAAEPSKRHLYASMLPAGIEADERDHVAGNLLPYAKKIWADMHKLNGDFKYSFEDYLKQYQLRKPKLPGDLVLFDEAQDASPVTADIVANQKSSQRIYVGDEMQAIMGFTGAYNAMSKHDGARLSLTQSFRFGPEIAAFGNLFLSMLDAPLRVKGFDNVKSEVVDDIEAPDAILCRTNGGVIGSVFRQINAGRRVATPGDGFEIKRLAEAAAALQAGRPTEHQDLYMFKTWEDVQEHCDIDPSAAGLKVFVKIVDVYGTDAILGMVSQLARINTRYPQPFDVMVTTAHKSKGLQFGKVQIGPDFPDPPEDPEKQLDESELMLAYVAVTRAQHEVSPGSLGWALLPADPTKQEFNCESASF